jgi:ABC-type Mn2+/Zn2+ transport system permease subunit
MLDPFQLPFMQRAAFEVALLAPLAGLLGAQIVLRHLAFFTHGVGAATFPGLVVAGPAGIPPVLAALGAGGAFAAALERLARRRGVAYDAATALLLVLALAAGIVLASDVFHSGSGVDQLLFGSLLAIGDRELAATAIALMLGLAAGAVARRAWIAAGFDGGASGPLRIDAKLADWLLVGAITITVVVSLDAAGALLVSGLLVIPAAIARVFARSVAALELGAAAIALALGLVGLRLAYEMDVPPGAAISALGGGAFAIAVGLRELSGAGR